jgi:tetratricopeptide (TPR) repeat protein
MYRPGKIFRRSTRTDISYGGVICEDASTVTHETDLDGSPRLLGFTLMVVRTAMGRKQGDLAAAMGTTRSVISSYEKGTRKLRREKLALCAERMGFDPADLEPVLLLAGWVLAMGESAESGDREAAEERIVGRAVGRVARSGGQAVRLGVRRALLEARGRRMRKEAAELWRAVKSLPAHALAVLGEGAREYQTWAFCERVCGESERAAADGAPRALELAEVAVRVAGCVPDSDGRRARVQGYAWAHVGNARRVANDHEGAERAFARCRELRQAGAADEEGFLDDALPLDLEASLRRDQRRFEEALSLHKRALAAASSARWVEVLLNKAVTLEQAGRPQEAVELLVAAAPRLDVRQQPRQLFALRFNLAVNLCQLGGHEKAEAIVTEVRQMAVASGDELDLIRVLWLEARVAAGLGRRAAAIAALRQVRRDFEVRGLAYDMALASLDLAALLLEDGQTGEVKALVEKMVATFRARGIAREALAALLLFRQAAEDETMTLTLVHRLARYLEQARHDSSLRFET